MPNAMSTLAHAKTRNLVICSVGDNSYHRRWLRGARRDFDVMLIYYGLAKDMFKEDADYYFQINGGLFKLERIAAAVVKSYDVVRAYDAVCLPDDDISMDASAVNRLFALFRKYDLDLAQPAVAGGTLSWPITAQNRYCVLRYVNFIEMMCPVFRSRILLEQVHTFNLNRSGWGVDFLWSKNLQERRLAIIDAVGMHHGRNISRGEREYYRQLAKIGIKPGEELDTMRSEYDCDLVGKMKEYGRISKPVLMRGGICVTLAFQKILRSLKTRGGVGTLRHILSKL